MSIPATHITHISDAPWTALYAFALIQIAVVALVLWCES